MIPLVAIMIEKATSWKKCCQRN